MELLDKIKADALQGRGASVDDCMKLADAVGSAVTLDDLCDAADEIRRKHQGDHIDTCCIVNARSGRCTENCKWCAQAASHHTGCEEYAFVAEDEFTAMLDRHTARGVGRLSMVCSGRKVALNDIKRFCEMYVKARKRSDIGFCASMGLLNREELQALYDAGVRRYHCNLETSASYFPALCTSHTREDKLRTIRLAREVGMEVCSGGIIGMGESLRQRLEMVQEACEAGAVSVPVNLLNPIPGTPLEGTPLLGEHEIILTVALMRFVAPTLALRFAGGRARLSKEATARILRGGMNGALVGDMLTTVGNRPDEDFELFRSLGYEV